ncbi:MAG: hypothetical protein Tsb0020_23790 [Haliangiales bacterium]
MWLIYALGGGLGHLTRATALARAVLRRGHAVTLLVNTALAGLVPYRRELPGAEIVELSAALDRAGVAARVHEILARGGFEALIVDTFPRGLGGELSAYIATWPGAKIWIHRLLCDEYIAWGKLADVVDHYQRVLIPGEPARFADHPRARVTAPWLIRDADELLPRERARRELEVDPTADCVLVSGTGSEREIRAAAALAERLTRALSDSGTRAVEVRFSGLGVAGMRWPLLRWLRGVDLLIGAGGYNTVSEARATATSLLAFAQPRRYDRQVLRLRAGEHIDSERDVCARALAQLRQRRGRADERLWYDNGVHRAVDEIEAAVAERRAG